MTEPDTIVLIHGFWVTPRSWEHWIAHYEAARLPRPRARLPRLRRRGRGAQRRPRPDRGGDGAADHRAARGRRRRARRAADPDRPLRRRRVHAGPARPRVRRRGRGDQLGADRGRQARAAVADPGDVPRAQEPRQPPPRRRLHVRAVALRVHQHVHRGRVARALRALPHPGLRRDLLGQRAGQHPPRARRQPRATTTTTTARRCCSSPAARTTSCRRRSSGPTRSTTSRDTLTEVKEFEGPHLLPALARWEEVADYALDWALEHAGAARAAG